MLNNRFAKVLDWAVALPLLLLPLGWSLSALAEPEEPEMNELEALCAKFRHNSACEDQDSYIFLEEWKQNETLCSLATEWKNEEKKCRVMVEGNKLTIDVEDGAVFESLPNTFKTKTMSIDLDLDEIFAFDAQWWLADVEVTTVENYLSGANSNESNNRSDRQEYSSRTTKNAAGAFTELQIGFISQADNSATDAKFLTISSKNLHQIIEQMEAWRFYLPDLTAFESQLKAISDQNPPTSVASNVTKLKDTNQCPGCDLRNAELSELELENANLRGANLAGANLAKTKLKSAYLLGAKLTEANLVDANLETANLMFASLVKADLSEANLKGANLQNTNLRNADLSGAELKAKDLKGTSLKNANLNNANLTDADLRCVDFQSASLKNANLTNIDLSPCEETIEGFLHSSQLSNIRLNDVGTPFTAHDDILNVVNIVGNLIKAAINPSAEVVLSLSFPKVNYRQAGSLSGANLNGADLTDADLSGVNLTDTNLSNAILVDTKLKDNYLSNANFIATNIEEVDFKDPIFICEATFSDESVYEEYCQPEDEEKE